MWPLWQFVTGTTKKKSTRNDLLPAVLVHVYRKFIFLLILCTKAGRAFSGSVSGGFTGRVHAQQQSLSLALMLNGAAAGGHQDAAHRASSPHPCCVVGQQIQRCHRRMPHGYHPASTGGLSSFLLPCVPSTWPVLKICVYKEK